MKIDIKTLENKVVGDITLPEAIFDVPYREDIVSRVVRWQRSKRRSGNHKTKGISEISGTTKKPFSQKGTGRARLGSLRATQLRGGATVFGPVVRSHEHDLPKKVRALGLKVALSEMLRSGSLIVLDSLDIGSSKTKDLKSKLQVLNIENALFVSGASSTENFAKASNNLAHIDIIPFNGLNVYDMLRHEFLVLTKDAIDGLKDRLV